MTSLIDLSKFTNTHYPLFTTHIVEERTLFRERIDGPDKITIYITTIVNGRVIGESYFYDPSFKIRPLETIIDDIKSKLHQVIRNQRLKTN